MCICICAYVCVHIRVHTHMDCACACAYRLLDGPEPLVDERGEARGQRDVLDEEGVDPLRGTRAHGERRRRSRRAAASPAAGGGGGGGGVGQQSGDDRGGVVVGEVGVGEEADEEGHGARAKVRQLVEQRRRG